MKRKRVRKIIDPVRIQFSVSARLKPGKQISPEALEVLIRRWINKQPIPKGVKVNAVVWQNPDRTRQADRNWRGAGDRDAIARLLPNTPVQFTHETAEESRDSLAAITLTQPIAIKTMG